MKPLPAALLLLSAALAAPADGQPARANALTAKEAADGWLLLFDGETTFGWKIDGQARVQGGALVLGGDKATTAAPTAAFADGTLDFETRWDGDKPPEIDLFGGAMNLTLNDATRGKFARQETFRVNVPPGAPLAARVPAGTTLSLRNVRLQPGGLKPIFNGKDLTGWKEVKTDRTKSRFTVTPEGWLNIKNGPGDLQTEGQWDDFVLQLDCRSNGEHLNSGVFFRCLPGQFWSGYEAQVRNQWQGDDRTRPVDYGTGGLYNRQPARKVVSSDKEWFTMTVAARGPHIAIWVNGYQTVEFTDTRPASDSARKGTKTARGPVSLQGHDPTTDLSFRNLRVAALRNPPAK
jgi:hypothetical protein